MTNYLNGRINAFVAPPSKNSADSLKELERLSLRTQKLAVDTKTGVLPAAQFIKFVFINSCRFHISPVV